MALAPYKGPAYMRFAREKTAQMTTSKMPFTIGKAQVFKNGKDLCFIGCGPVVWEALQAAVSLEKRGIKAMVINCHTVKPLDEKTILAAARKCKKVITIEEAQINGGLGGAVAELLSEKCPVPLVRVGINDHFGESGEPEELLHKFGLSKERLVKEGERM